MQTTDTQKVRKNDMAEDNGHEDKNILKQLLDPSYPLAQRFKEVCPGTYKHSQSLVTMIEGVSLALNLDVDFMKVAALYHDVGKMFNPTYFTENQLDDENPHDKLDPKISYQIITRHVSDTSLILLNDPLFPREIIEIATQHHGTTITKYFFDKAGSKNEDSFRYRGSKPKTVEAMILLICDHLEARTRSDVQAGKKISPSDLIEEIIKHQLSDGQLDDVVMRLGDLQKIKTALSRELEGIYQKRVDYSKAKEEQNTK
jgi:putative nucleotidyltransferase with HDIG domain